MGKYPNWSKTTRPPHKLETHDFDEVKEVWEHDHMEDTYAYYGTKINSDKAILRVSEFGVTVHRDLEYDTLTEAEEVLRTNLKNNPYFKGMEVWYMSDYGVHKGIVQEIDKSNGDWVAKVKTLESIESIGVESGERTWISMDSIDQAESMDGYERKQMRRG